MFEHFDTKKDLFEFQLGSALTMEHDSLAMLKELERVANDEEVRDLFAHHQTETQQQIDNLERAFQLLGTASERNPSQTTKGLMKEGAAIIAKSDRSLIDEVALSAALGTEHYEISTYESLCTSADALGFEEIRALLEQNLEQEQHTSEELKAFATKLAHA